MAKNRQEIIDDIKSHMQKRGGEYSDWYVGISKDAKDRLFNDHSVKEKKDVWIYRSASSSGTRSLDKASERALNNADFPAIPESFSGDQLTFSLVMEYREYQSPARRSYLDAKKRKQGAVTGTRIAILGGTGLTAAK